MFTNTIVHSNHWRPKSRKIGIPGKQTIHWPDICSTFINAHVCPNLTDYAWKSRFFTLYFTTYSVVHEHRSYIKFAWQLKNVADCGCSSSQRTQTFIVTVLHVVSTKDFWKKNTKSQSSPIYNFPQNPSSTQKYTKRGTKHSIPEYLRQSHTLGGIVVWR